MNIFSLSLPKPFFYATNSRFSCPIVFLHLTFHISFVFFSPVQYRSGPAQKKYSTNKNKVWNKCLLMKAWWIFIAWWHLLLQCALQGKAVLCLLSSNEIKTHLLLDKTEFTFWPSVSSMRNTFFSFCTSQKLLCWTFQKWFSVSMNTEFSQATSTVE